MENVIVIGAGPAGLMAAETLADRGHKVTMVEAMPSIGRKFLYAGKSGLNLTKDEPFEEFLGNFCEAAEWLRPILKNFDNQDVITWAKSLDQEVFTGTSGRVFPQKMKASPILRAWLARLATKGVTVKTRWNWRGWSGETLLFDTPDGPHQIQAAAAVLALGGSSWSRLGSNGKWAGYLADKGAKITPFQPANIGWQVNWSPFMSKYFGQPVKSCALIVENAVSQGEFVIAKRGLEGGGIYAVSKSLRESSALHLDLKPGLSVEKVTEKLSQPRGKTSLSNFLRKSLKLDPVHTALLQEFARPLPKDPVELAKTIKHLPVPLTGPNPLDEAISTSGGVALSNLDNALMLKTIPGVFCCGEMLDWEAPTGGYLITASLATGRQAGAGASDYLQG